LAGPGIPLASSPAAANTGGGSGGSDYGDPLGGAGGSGIVIIKVRQ
jgi:hypothetical protein